MKRICVQCGKEFYLSNSEIRYFKERKLYLPKRCKECRSLNKAKKADRTVSNETVILEQAPKQKEKGLLERIFSFLHK